MAFDVLDLQVPQGPRREQLLGQQGLVQQGQVGLALGQSGHPYHDLSYGVEEEVYQGPDHFALY